MSIQPGRAVTAEEKAAAQEHLNRARAAMRSVDGYDQATVDRLCRAVAWATANEQTFGRLTRMSVNESGMGSAEGVPARRWKILGILRDALRTKSVGIIEDLPEKGIVKYAKPAGVIAGVLPVTNPLVTMVNMTINAVKCRDAVIFSPHPLSRKTALEITRVLRTALKKQGAPEDLVQCLATPSIPLAQELMAICDLTIATGGAAMVKAAYSSGCSSLKSSVSNLCVSTVFQFASPSMPEAVPMMSLSLASRRSFSNPSASYSSRTFTSVRCVSSAPSVGGRMRSSDCSPERRSASAIIERTSSA